MDLRLPADSRRDPGAFREGHRQQGHELAQGHVREARIEGALIPVVGELQGLVEPWAGGVLVPHQRVPAHEVVVVESGEDFVRVDDLVDVVRQIGLQDAGGDLR